MTGRGERSDGQAERRHNEARGAERRLGASVKLLASNHRIEAQIWEYVSAFFLFFFIFLFGVSVFKSSDLPPTPETEIQTC